MLCFFAKSTRNSRIFSSFLEGRGTRVMASNSSQTSFGSNFVISDISYKVLLSVLFFLPAKVGNERDSGSNRYRQLRISGEKTSGRQQNIVLRHVTCPHANSPFANIRISRVPSKLYFRKSRRVPLKKKLKAGSIFTLSGADKLF